METLDTTAETISQNALQGAFAVVSSRVGRRSPAAVAARRAPSALYAEASTGGLISRGGSALGGNSASSTPARNLSLATAYAAANHFICAGG